MVSQEEIEEFLLGLDPEPYIVALEYDYATDKIFKVIQHPEQGKIVKVDSFIPFAWVGDLHNRNFYQGSKELQKKAMSEHGIVIDKLNTMGDPRLELGLRFLVKTTKTYQNLINFFKNGGLEPWGRDNSDVISILPPPPVNINVSEGVVDCNRLPSVIVKICEYAGWLPAVNDLIVISFEKLSV